MWADGSGRFPTDPRLRTCTWAIYAGPTHPDMWMAGVLPGRVQTIFRAELYAVLRALRATKGPLEVVSACVGVVNSGNRYLRGKKVSPKAAHADLWRQLQCEAEGRGVTLRWVPPTCRSRRCGEDTYPPRTGLVTKGQMSVRTKP